jgi:peptide/nickel transport system substrate-binding protein
MQSLGELMKRRDLLAFSASALAVPSLVRAEARRVLRFMLHIDLPSLDPIWTGNYPTRTHGYMVFDTLFGQDSLYRTSPQMLEGVLVEGDGKRWTLTLRKGLKFHDGEPVLARDCVASVRRWGQRHTLGQALMRWTDELSAADDRTIVFRLKKPFPLLPDALGSWESPMPAIMPERLAKTDAFTQVTELVGSGPYRFLPTEHISGARLVYERFADYRPREDGTSDFTAGPKIAHFDRVEWTIISDASTAAAALQTGEQDWWRTADWDHLPLLRRNRAIKLMAQDALGDVLILRMNHLQPPFNNPGIRRALLGAVNQEDFVTVSAGADPSLWRTGVGYFPPASTMASGAGLEALTGEGDFARARQEIAAAGYKGERVALVIRGDSLFKKASDVGADLLKKVGLNVDYQLTDFATSLQRLAKQEPVDQGGWSCYFGDNTGGQLRNPAVHPLLRGNRTSPNGWMTSPRIEELRDAWFDTPELAIQQRISAQMQLQAFQDVPYIPLGLVYLQTAYRADLTGVLSGWPLFWGVRREA